MGKDGGGDGGGGGGGGGSAAFLYGLIALIYIGLFAVRTNSELGFFFKNNNSHFPTSVVAKNNLCMQVMIWFLSQPKSLDRMKNRWWEFFTSTPGHGDAAIDYHLDEV